MSPFCQSCCKCVFLLKGRCYWYNLFQHPFGWWWRKAAQLFVGRDTKLVSIHPIKGEDKASILGAFQDRVRWHGAPAELRVDNAAVYKGPKFLKYIQDLYIRLWQSKSYHQQQNYTENVWQSLKFGTNRLLDFTGATQDVCFATLIFYAFIWNHIVDPTLADGNHSPYTLATGCSNYISALCAFRFWEPVYYLVDPEE